MTLDLCSVSGDRTGSFYNLDIDKLFICSLKLIPVGYRLTLMRSALRSQLAKVYLHLSDVRVKLVCFILFYSPHRCSGYIHSVNAIRNL